MNTLKKYIPWIPEIYLILSVFFYWANAGSLINLYAIALLILLAIVILVKNKAFNITISTLFLILNCYMVLAMLSELSEFPEFNDNARLMLTVGSIYLGIGLFLSIVMLRKWQGKESEGTIKLA